MDSKREVCHLEKVAITGIYLAAGQSKRFGRNKLFPPFGQYPLGSIALKSALESELDYIAVVTKQTDSLEWVPPELWKGYEKKWQQVPCPAAICGQAYSLKCGLRFAQRNHSEAVIIMLADQPLASKEMINQTIDQYLRMKSEQTQVSFIASCHSGIPQPPILFTRSMFEELAKLDGDKGARFLIRDRMDEGSVIHFKNPQLFFDVDTEADYVELTKKMNQQ